MKLEAVLTNTTRDPIVDEIALTKALSEEKISGAAFDVFEVEPIPKTSRLLQIENVMLAPHNANSSPEAWERIHWNTIRNLFDG